MMEDDEMKAKRLLSMIALVLALAMCFAACGEPSEAPDTTATPTDNPGTQSGAENAGDSGKEYDDTITIDMNSEVTNFDPAYLAGVTTSRVACFMMDHLCYMDHDGNIIPRVAESWEANEDATVWTFHLRKDVKWHDGTPLVAADLKYNFDRIINPDVAALRAGDLACVDSVEAPDDYTVVFKLNTPVAAFITKCLLINPGLLAQPKALEEYGESYSDHVVGTDFGLLADSDLPNHNWAYTPDTLKYNYDPEYAKQCLADSGWTDTDGDGLVDKDGQTLKLEIGCTKRESDNVMLEAAQNYLRQVGIDVSMAVLENAAYNERLHGADFQAYVLNISQDSPEPALLIDFSFPTWAGYNKFGYDNPRVDELVLAANSTGDQEERKELYIEIQKIIKEDYVSLPFYSRYAQVGVSAKVEGFTHSAAIFDLQDVRVAK